MKDFLSPSDFGGRTFPKFQDVRQKHLDSFFLRPPFYPKNDVFFCTKNFATTCRCFPRWCGISLQIFDPSHPQPDLHEWWFHNKKWTKIQSSDPCFFFLRKVCKVDAAMFEIYEYNYYIYRCIHVKKKSSYLKGSLQDIPISTWI